MSPSITSLAQQTQLVYNVINSTRLGPTCASLFPSVQDRWQCLFGQYRMPMLTTPYMLNAAQFDKFQLPYNIGGNTVTGYLVQGWDRATEQYANAFQAPMQGVIGSLPTPKQNTSAVFSSACFRHCVTDRRALHEPRPALSSR